MLRTPFVPVLAALALGGCLSVAEVRATSPTRTGDTPGDYSSLAECVATKARQEHPSRMVSYDMEDIPAARTARVTATGRYPGGLFYTVPTPLVELTFRQPDEGNVKIEARRGPLGIRYEPRMWAVVSRCAGDKVTISPPLT
jgi:hypothetical protein